MAVRGIVAVGRALVGTVAMAMSKAGTIPTVEEYVSMV